MSWHSTLQGPQPCLVHCFCKQRNKDTVGCAAPPGVEVHEHFQEQLTQTLIVCLFKKHTRHNPQLTNPPPNPCLPPLLLCQLCRHGIDYTPTKKITSLLKINLLKNLIFFVWGSFYNLSHLSSSPLTTNIMTIPHERQWNRSEIESYQSPIYPLSSTAKWWFFVHFLTQLKRWPLSNLGPGYIYSLRRLPLSTLPPTDFLTV